MKSFYSGLAISLALCVPGRVDARACEGVTLPDSVVVAGQRLVLNGMGIREATALQVDVYVAGLYVPTRGRDAEALLAGDTPRRIVMNLVRDVSREDAIEGFTTGLRNNNPNDTAALAPAVSRLRSMVQAMHVGDVVTITYVPATGTEITINGQSRGTIEGALFGRAIFRNFIGPRPPNRGLRVGLLGGTCS
jgi:hypothetical protein